MTKHDTHTHDDAPLIDPVDVPAALGLLTRLPIKVDTTRAVARGAQAAWAWPVAGLVPAGLAAVTGFAALGLGAGPIWAATLAVGAQVMVTGAMHEDGLADTADGLWGGQDTARRLEIMKDSRIGAYGVIALILSFLLRISALAALLPLSGAFGAILVCGLVSRVPMVILMASLPNARKAGLAQSVGRVPVKTAGLATALGGVATLIFAPWALLALFFWIAVPVLALAALARTKIGGQTGDILGASQQLSEIAALAVFAALLSQT